MNGAPVTASTGITETYWVSRKNFVSIFL